MIVTHQHSMFRSKTLEVFLGSDCFTCIERDLVLNEDKLTGMIDRDGSTIQLVIKLLLSTGVLESPSNSCDILVN